MSASMRVSRRRIGVIALYADRRSDDFRRRWSKVAVGLSGGLSGERMGHHQGADRDCCGDEHPMNSARSLMNGIDLCTVSPYGV